MFWDNLCRIRNYLFFKELLFRNQKRDFVPNFSSSQNAQGLKNKKHKRLEHIKEVLLHFSKKKDFRLQSVLKLPKIGNKASQRDHRKTQFLKITANLNLKVLF
jgi:hypothetical protein